MLKTIESIQKALRKITNVDSEFANNIPPENSNRNNQNYSSYSQVHHYHHNSPSYMPYFIPSGSSHVVNNNYYGPTSTSTSTKEKEKKEKKKEPTSGEILLASAALAGVALSATYFATQDEYIKYWMSNLDDHISELENYDDPTARNIAKLYRKWSKQYTSRTLKKLVTKGTGVVSSGAIIYGGMIVGASSGLFLGGIAGLTLSGCYYIWQQYTQDQDDETENLKALIDAIDTYIQSQHTPSAPPQYDNSDYKKI